MAGFVRLAHGIDAGRPVETPAVLRERYPVADRPDGPALSVDLSREGDEVVASVDTDGAAVAVKTRSDAAYVEPDAERVTVRVETGGSDPWVVVAAAGGTDLRRHGTTVVHRTP